MKKILLTFAVIGLAFSTTTAQSQLIEKKPQERRAITEAKQKTTRQMERLDKVVTLTDMQKEQIRAILLSKVDSKLDKKQLEQELRKEIEPLLTKEQIAKFEAYQAQMQKPE